MTRALKGFALVRLDELEPSPENPRERLTDIEDLAASIREHGMIQPIIAQRIPGHPRLRIVAGHRRLAAAQRLRLPEVPVIIRRDLLPDEELLAMMVENGQRADLDPIEEARALNRLHSAGISETDIARRVGRSVHWVKGRLVLLQLPAAEQDELRAGHSTLSRAERLLREQRKREREKANPVARPIGRPKGAKTKPYFGDDHPLAKHARARCSCKAKPKVGGVACGACWEQTIRDDEHRESERAAHHRQDGAA